MCISGCAEEPNRPNGNGTGTGTGTGTTNQQDLPDPSTYQPGTGMAWHGDSGVTVTCPDGWVPQVAVIEGGANLDGWVELPSGAGGGMSGGGAGSGLMARCVQ